MKIDAHQHFWKYGPEYPWIPTGSALQRDWLPSDLLRLQEPLGFAGSIAVQARQTLAESEWLLELADHHPEILGVVGWVDLRDPWVDRQLEQLSVHPRWVGVRHVVQDEPDDQFMLQPDFLQGLARLPEFDLTYDLLIYPRQLPAALQVVRRFPKLSFVLDHGAKPPIREGALEPWAGQIRELARHPNVVCKLSGLVTEANHTRWSPDDLRPYLDVLVEAFGPSRLMYGSDWPVCLLAAEYARTVQVIEEYTANWNAEDRAALWGDTARRIYLG